jgi:hypothetical protein
MKTKLTMGIIKKWITDSLSQDSDFEALCQDTIGGKLNYYRSTPIDLVYEKLPYFTAFSNYSEFSKDGEWEKTFMIPCSIGIQADLDPLDETNSEVFESVDKVEIIAVEAMRVLHKEITCGVKGEDLRILGWTLNTTEIGEADEVQGVLVIRFGLISTL